jgi:hypothetical protein
MVFRQEIVSSLILGLSPCEAFASLILEYFVDYRQKKPLKYYTCLSLQVFMNKDTLSYQKINFFTMPASFNHIIWVKYITQSIADFKSKR